MRGAAGESMVVEGNEKEILSRKQHHPGSSDQRIATTICSPPSGRARFMENGSGPGALVVPGVRLEELLSLGTSLRVWRITIAAWQPISSAIAPARSSPRCQIHARQQVERINRRRSSPRGA